MSYEILLAIHKTKYFDGMKNLKLPMTNMFLKEFC